MKFYKDSCPVKGMIFAGCSFTWGQGLWYYSYSSTLREDLPNHYNFGLTNESHNRFKEILRYPRLVANHFNTYEIVHPKNGGAHDQMVEYWSRCFSTENREKVLLKSFNYDYTNRSLDDKELDEIETDHPHMVDRTMPIRYEDISHFVFQFSQWTRDRILVPYYDGPLTIKLSAAWDTNGEYNKLLIDRLLRENKTLGEFNEEAFDNSLMIVKNFLEHLEDKGIKTYVLSYPQAVAERACQDSWFKDRFIDISYQGKDYRSFENLITDFSKMEIAHDFENFEVPPKDGHPSKLCHQTVAQSIIDRIKKDLK